jgi:hypothetical protein
MRKGCGRPATADKDEKTYVKFPKHFRAYALVLLITSFHSWSAPAKDKPDAKDKLSFRVDLKQFGYNTDAAEYSSLGFLPNDLLLVVINQRVFYRLDGHCYRFR